MTKSGPAVLVSEDGYVSCASCRALLGWVDPAHPPTDRQREIESVRARERHECFN
ncbi:MAG: hypothetical protein ACLQL8_08205 [Thermoplasmata archaeon]